MVFYEIKYYPIIEVEFKKYVYEIFKGNYYNSRKKHMRILNSKAHYHILETSPLCHKGIFVSTFLCNPNMMVTKKSISEWVKFLSSDTIQHLIYKQGRKRVM